MTEVHDAKASDPARALHGQSSRSEEQTHATCKSTAPASVQACRTRTTLTVEQAIEVFKYKVENPKTSKRKGSIRHAKMLADRYSVSEKAIRDVWRGRTWKYETQHLRPSPNMQLDDARPTTDSSSDNDSNVSDHRSQKKSCVSESFGKSSSCADRAGISDQSALKTKPKTNATRASKDFVSRAVGEIIPQGRTTPSPPFKPSSPECRLEPLRPWHKRVPQKTDVHDRPKAASFASERAGPCTPRVPAHSPWAAALCAAIDDMLEAPHSATARPSKLAAPAHSPCARATESPCFGPPSSHPSETPSFWLAGWAPTDHIHTPTTVAGHPFLAGQSDLPFPPADSRLAVPGMTPYVLNAYHQHLLFQLGRQLGPYGQPLPGPTRGQGKAPEAAAALWNAAPASPAALWNVAPSGVSPLPAGGGGGAGLGGPYFDASNSKARGLLSLMLAASDPAAADPASESEAGPRGASRWW
mmetsp:Transcript_88777/g.236287  ORF Transcript_88777/g.236287 Transcript_88777/m.236287 type:complete len:471 (+) Transcript_88777:3-1415(+)